LFYQEEFYKGLTPEQIKSNATSDFKINIKMPDNEQLKRMTDKELFFVESIDYIINDKKDYFKDSIPSDIYILPLKDIMQTIMPPLSAHGRQKQPWFSITRTR
jgi:hypothetical protein